MSIFTPFEDLFSSATDVATSIADRTPGVPALGKALSQAYLGGQKWLEGASKTPVFGYVMIKVSNAIVDAGIVPALIPIIGPAATVFVALPGMTMKGEKFTDAYIQGTTQRLIETAKATLDLIGADGDGNIIPPDAQKMATYAAESWAGQLQQIATDPQVQQWISQVGNAVGDQATQGIRDALAQAHLTPEDLAAKFGARPDVAAMAINLLLKKNVYDPKEFDPATGQSTAPFVTGNLTSQQLAAQAAAFIAKARKTGASPAQVAAMQQQYQGLSTDSLLGNKYGLSFMLGPPLAVSFGAPTQVLLDTAVLAGALYLLSRLGRR